MKFMLILLMMASLAFAGENDKLHIPKSFNVNGTNAVFADFSEANYVITYDLTQKKAFVKAEIIFETVENGYPIFDSVSTPSLVKLDGSIVEAVETKTPNSESTLRYVKKLTEAGIHTLSVEVPLDTLVEFTASGVKSAFWTSDLNDRRYLERYLPANFEFDQVKMTFEINIIGAKAKHVIYTNGEMTELKSNNFKISYPEYFTSSSLFFHLVPVGTTTEKRFTLKSIDGRELPAVVYYTRTPWGSNLDKLQAKTTEIFHELESDYGAFPHPSITVLQAGSGGMEYSGATMTDFSALGHELFHSYFARGVMPANGNAGWIDEALASWRDGGYETNTSLSGSTAMSSHAYYTRTTDTAAYSFGKRFMGYMNGKLQDKGGLKPFMRYMVDKKVFTPFFIEEFIAEMSNFYGTSLDADFKQFTFGKGNFFSPIMKMNTEIHRKMTIEEMKNYL